MPCRARCSADLELVLFTVREVRNEDLPDPARRQQPHRVHASVPRVEIADHAHAIRIGSPDGEVHAGGRADRRPMRAELFERAMMRPFAQQMQIEVGEHAAVAVRVVDLDNVFPRVCDAEPIIRKATRPPRPILRVRPLPPFLPLPPLPPISPDLRHAELENPCGIALRHREALAGRHQAQIDGAGRGLKHSNEIAVRTEDGKRIAIQSADERSKSRLERAGLVSWCHRVDLIGIRGGQAGWAGRAGSSCLAISRSSPS